MKIKIPAPILVLIAGTILFLPPMGFCDEMELLPEFTQNDRVLILAPHPDDEMIGTGGVIQKTIKAGAKTKVVCFTNGDNNELAFIVYEKRLTFRKGEFLHMGEVRRKETLAATTFLGLNPKDVIFLGYPDFGTLEILTKYWGETKPFKSMFTRVTNVAYPEAMSVGAPYVGESILKDLEKILFDFKPTKIFVSHPADTNRDHQSLYLFLHLALWDLGGQIKDPDIFPYLIHVSGWPRPKGYRPNLELHPTKKLDGQSWAALPLIQDEIEIKHKAIGFYKSQIPGDPSYLFTFARKNELFGDLPSIQLKNKEESGIVWQMVDGPTNPNEKVSTAEDTDAERPSDLFYAVNNNQLFVKIILKRKADKNLGISLFLIGHNNSLPFSLMPKIQISINALGLHIKNKRHPIFIKGAEIMYQNRELVLKIPLPSLGNPNHILSRVKTNAGDLSLSETAWRIIEIEQP